MRNPEAGSVFRAVISLGDALDIVERNEIKAWLCSAREVQLEIGHAADGKIVVCFLQSKREGTRVGQVLDRDSLVDEMVTHTYSVELVCASAAESSKSYCCDGT